MCSFFSTLLMALFLFIQAGEGHAGNGIDIAQRLLVVVIAPATLFAAQQE